MPPKPEYTAWRNTQHATIEREFTHHAPDPATAAVHDHVRALFRTAAHRLNELLPECEPKKVALAQLRAAMWASNSAVACYGDTDEHWMESMGDWLALPVHVDEDLVDRVLAAAAEPGADVLPLRPDIDQEPPVVGRAEVTKPEHVLVRPYVVPAVPTTTGETA